MKVILTGATGTVGEGVLLECLQNPLVTEVLVIGRKDCGYMHPKMKQILISDFTQIENMAEHIKGYDACFFCAGVKSSGVKEDKYHQITYDLTVAFAKVLHKLNPNMVFNYVTERASDSSECGKVFWAKINGKTENELMRMGFKAQHNFRPALVVPTKGQVCTNPIFRLIAKIWKFFWPEKTVSLKQVGQAMIHTVSKGFHKSVLEVEDIVALSM